VVHLLQFAEDLDYVLEARDYHGASAHLRVRPDRIRQEELQEEAEA
jgi:hypothetical protein